MIKVFYDANCNNSCYMDIIDISNIFSRCNFRGHRLIYQPIFQPIDHSRPSIKAFFVLDYCQFIIFEVAFLLRGHNL